MKKKKTQKNSRDFKIYTLKSRTDFVDFIHGLEGVRRKKKHYTKFTL